MRLQSSTILSFSPKPVPAKAYAREATGLAKLDPLKGVLMLRIAALVCVAPWDEAADDDKDEAIALARQILDEGDRILLDPAAYPSDLETAQFDAWKRHQQARHAVAYQAHHHRHQLTEWQPDIDRHGWEIATCAWCGSGASVDRVTGSQSISDAFLQDCRRV